MLHICSANFNYVGIQLIYNLLLKSYIVFLCQQQNSTCDILICQQPIGKGNTYARISFQFSPSFNSVTHVLLLDRCRYARLSFDS
uniref:Uncharacterized protein n=1 Tax=Arundo donax TaxID=35708 RepID=A0A0A9QUK6_ARUDO